MGERLPHWQHTGFNQNGHPVYNWPDAEGNTHILTGFMGAGKHKAPVERVGPKLASYARRCESGACTHAFTPDISQDISPEELAQFEAEERSNPPFRHGEQVSHQGQPHYVGDSEPIDGEWYHDLIHAHTGETNPMVPASEIEKPKTANILDSISDQLDERVFLQPKTPLPVLKPEHRTWIINTVQAALSKHGYDDSEKWLSLAFTGSLTTYQYSDGSDVDVSLFVNTEVFPEWSRAEMIGIMVGEVDGNNLPGTPFPMQCFVVPQGITKEDLYKPGLRSGYDLDNDRWIVPPELDRVHDVEHEMNGFYTVALESCDKLQSLIRYEPDKAKQFWHIIHKRRQRDQRQGKGDYSQANITYKMIANRGMFKELSDLTGEYLA